MNENALTDRVALITGAGDGMGRAHALLMAERGADIAIVDINRAGAEETAAGVRRLGRRALVLEADVAHVAQVEKAAAAAQQEFGRVDILVNNAGYGQRATTPEIDEAAFDRMLAVHVKGSFFFTRAVIGGMKERRWRRITARRRPRSSSSRRPGPRSSRPGTSTSTRWRQAACGPAARSSSTSPRCSAPRRRKCRSSATATRVKSPMRLLSSRRRSRTSSRDR